MIIKCCDTEVDTDNYPLGTGKITSSSLSDVDIKCPKCDLPLAYETYSPYTGCRFWEKYWQEEY